MSYRVSVNVGEGESQKKTVIGIGTTQEKAIVDALDKLSTRLTRDGRAELEGANIFIGKDDEGLGAPYYPTLLIESNGIRRILEVGEAKNTISEFLQRLSRLLARDGKAPVFKMPVIFIVEESLPEHDRRPEG